MTIVFQYVLFLFERGLNLTATTEQLKKDWDLISFLVSFFAVVAIVVFALLRELQFHTAVDRIIGLRKKINTKIAALMATLAQQAGYPHPDRISSNQDEAREWFYSYANMQRTLRIYAFEVWEAYFVNLYLSVACLVSFICSIGLAWFLPIRTVTLPVALSLVLFVLFWVVRKKSIVPRVLAIARQQVREIKPDADVRAEASRRFGD